MIRSVSALTKKLLAITLLVLVGFLPAFGQVNATKPSAKPAKPALVSPTRKVGATHRRRHRRHLRRRVRRLRRRLRHRRHVVNTNTNNNNAVK